MTDIHEYGVDPTSNVGFVVFAWERIENLIERAILELAGCPDYRARAFTTYLSFPNKWKAMRLLLRTTRDNYASFLKPTLGSFETEVFHYRQLRNALVHSQWTGFHVEEENPAIAGSDYDARKDLRRRDLVFENRTIISTGKECYDLGDRLADFLRSDCEIDASPEKFELPLLKE
jgi:hypothetical protein